VGSNGAAMILAVKFNKNMDATSRSGVSWVRKSSLPTLLSPPTCPVSRSFKIVFQNPAIGIPRIFTPTHKKLPVAHLHLGLRNAKNIQYNISTSISSFEKLLGINRRATSRILSFPI
jgi:hypothetical protein